MQTKATVRGILVMGGLLMASLWLTLPVNAQTAAPTTAAPTTAATAVATMTMAVTALPTSPSTLAATSSATKAATVGVPLTVQPIKAARAATDGTIVMVQGTVTVATYLFDQEGRSLYIQDATGGINVYFGKGGLPTLAEGDTLQVSGKMLTFANHREIAPASLDAVKKLNTDAPKPLTPTLIHSADGRGYAGQLARIQGVIVAGSTDYFVLTDSTDVNQGNVNVYLYDTTGIGFGIVAVQQSICVTGIVDPYNAALEILPRHPDDLQLGTCPQ